MRKSLIKWVSLPFVIILSKWIGYIIVATIGELSLGKLIGGASTFYYIRVTAAICGAVFAYKIAIAIAPNRSPKIGIAVCIFMIVFSGSFVIIALFQKNEYNVTLLIMEYIASIVAITPMLTINTKRLISNNKQK